MCFRNIAFRFMPFLQDMNDAAEVCLARCKTVLQQKYAGMSQLSKLIDMLASSITAQKISVETDVRDLHQRLVKDSLKMAMDMQKAEFEVQTALVACTEDYALFKRSVKHLATFEPQKGSQASDTLERGWQWLSQIERIPCNLSGCPCICLRKDLLSHQELCLFKIPLFPRNAIQIEEGVSCSEGFHLVANDPNSDLARYSGAFQAGPCRHIDDDEPGWYHLIDASQRRIIRIKTQKPTTAFVAKIGSNPWCLSVWNDPQHETVLMQSEGQSIDDVKFPGLKLAPAKKIKGMKDGYSNAALAKDSVKLIYFGGEGVRSHVYIPVFEVSSSCAVCSSKVHVIQNLICFRRMVPVLPPVYQKTKNILRHRGCTVRPRGATGSIARQVRPAAAFALTQSPDHFLLK
jgi:hypothetical protein